MTRVLVVNPYGIGDVLATLPLVRALRAAYSTGRVGFLCNRRTESVVQEFPGLDEVIVFEKDEFRRLWREHRGQWISAVRRLAATVRRGRWDVAIDLSLNWQFGAALKLLGIPMRCGFDFRGRGRFLTQRLPLEGFSNRHVADYYLDVLQLLDLPRPTDHSLELPIGDETRREADAWLTQQGITPARPIVALVPGGGASWGPNASAKQWPPQQFAILTERLQQQSPGAQLVLIGDAADQPICRAVAAAARSSITMLNPAPSLHLLAGVLAQCQLVIGNDSGALHLAVAIGTPSVTIFGPASPVVYGPWTTATERHRVAVKNVPCRPCYDRFRLPPCPWEHRCLTTLDPDEVYAIARPLLAA